MEIVASEKDIDNLKYNSIRCSVPILKNSQIIFKGTDNIVYFENNAQVQNSKIEFHGSNSIVYISDTAKTLYLNISLNNNNCFYLGKNNYFNGTLCAVCSEEKHIFIGSNCLFSSGIVLRNADPHLIYSVNTRERINPSKSIYIGDSVWIGQNTLILKGTKIHSGSIIGGGTVAAGKVIPSNCSAAGNPCRVLSKNIFWRGDCVHSWTENETNLHQTCDKTDTVFQYDKDTYTPFDNIESVFSAKTSSDDKSEQIIDFFNAHSEKNRFAIFDDDLNI